MRNFLILSIFALTTTLTAHAEQIPCDGVAINGLYEGQVASFDTYNLEVFQMAIRVEIGQSSLNFGHDNPLINARVNIACGTKVIAALHTIRCYDDGTNRLTLLTEGSSQCSLGDNPEIIFYSDRLQIRTGFQTPGFRGNYDFRRTGDVTRLF